MFIKSILLQNTEILTERIIKVLIMSTGIKNIDIYDSNNREKLFELFLKLDNRELNETFIEVLEKINRQSRIYKIDGYIFLLVYKKSKINSIYYITNEENTSFEKIKTIHNYFEQIGEKYKIYDYKYISINGYKNSDNNIWIIEKFNMSLEDFEFIEKLLYKDLYKDNIELMPHNNYTYKNISNILNNNNKVCAIQATGTGKSFLAARCCLDFKEENKLILSSSYYILEQFKLNFDFLNEKTIFLHYGKLAQLNDEFLNEIKEFNPKLIVLDEFHRAGANEWSKGVVTLLSMFPNAKVLGTSATPIRYLDNFRDMSEELFDKNIANQITLFDALVNKILPMPKYIQAFFEIESEVNKRLKKIKELNNQNKSKLLIDTLMNEYNTKFDACATFKKHITDERKFVVFCKDYKHLEEMIPIVKKWFSSTFKDIPIEIYKVSSQYNNSEIEFNKFIKDKSNKAFKLLFAIDKMNEGVHTSSIDGLIFLRPTISPIIYFQQLGRCLQANKNKTPIIFDFVNNSNNIQSINFKQEILDAFDKINEERESLGLDLNEKEDLEDMISCIYDETIDILTMLKEIDDSLSIDWESNFNQLKEFYILNGHCNPPKEEKYKKINTWCENQRQLYKSEKLNQEKIDKLNSIEFIWEKYNHFWEEQYKKLVDYKQEYDSTIIPKTYDDYQLYTWTITQRILKNQDKLSEDRIYKLNEIDFVWDVDEYQWENQYNKIYDYYKTYGNFDIKMSESTKSLVKWMQTQRLDHKNNKIKPHRKEKLNAINFIWDTREKLWLNEYYKLVEFKNKNGHCNIKVSDSDKKLYKWVILQRLNRKNQKLTSDKINLLNDIDFIWNSRDTGWQEQFSKLKQFYMENNHLLIDEHYTDKSLVAWIIKQRSDYKKNKLSQEKIDKLNSIYFPWSLLDYKWEQQYSKLLKFKETFGTTKVPSNYEDSQLYQWVKQQKKSFKSNKLKQERLDKLNKIDFKW